MRCRSLVVAMLLLAGSCVALILAGRATAAPSTAGSYTAVAPQRILDTRYHVGVATTSPVSAQTSVTFAVRGTGTPAVPLAATAVVLNVTATKGTSVGHVTAYAGGSFAVPAVSNLNYVKAQSVPNLVVAPIGSAGTVSLYNGSATGSVHLLADISGYYLGGTPTAQGAFGSVAPTRLLDTRHKIGVTTMTPINAHSTVSFTVAGQAGVPADVSAVAMNITATGGTAGGYVAAYAAGSSAPPTSNLNYRAATTVPNLALVRVGDGGKVTIYNGSAGTVHLIADVQGYYAPGDPVGAGNLGALPPARALAATTILAGKTVTLSLAGKVGVPLKNVSSAVLNVTVTRPEKGGYLTVYQGARPPSVSNLNFAAGQTIANLVAAPLSTSGTVTFYNGSGGTVQVLADISGYVAGADLPPPPTSASHYVRNVSSGTGHFGDSTTTGVGCTDARAGDTFVLLDIGAQANDKSGVVLSVTQTKVSYAALVAATSAYIASYRACGTAPVTIAIGTNNGGDFGVYSASARGTDWATQVVNAITAPTGVTIYGANDIESDFSSTEAQAQEWETAFLAATATKLIYNGSADGCPDGYGAARATCAYGWTQANYYSLTHSGARIEALPQIYVAYQARQWANIDRLGGGAITFRGSLTEHAAACSDLCDMAPPQGWAFLYHALSTVVATPSLPVAADLDILD